MEWNYVYGLGQRLARYKGSDKDIYHNDHLRSLRVMTHRDGSVIGQQDYNPYGEKLASESYPGKYTYNGKEYMDDWGFDLYYYGARFMDPVTGRFITPDPVKDYTNQYTYVGNNPVNRIDPTGMYAGPILATAVNTLGLPTGPLAVGLDAIIASITNPWEELQKAKIKTRFLLEEGYKRADEMKANSGCDEDWDKWNCLALEFRYYLDNFETAVKFVDSQLYNDGQGGKYETGITGATRPGAPIRVTIGYINNNSISDNSKIRLLFHEIGHGSYQWDKGDVNYDDYKSRRASQEYCMTLEYEYWGVYGNNTDDPVFHRDYTRWLNSPDKNRFFDWRLQDDPYSQFGPWR